MSSSDPPFAEGDRVRILLPDPNGPDSHHNGEYGTITDIHTDELHTLTGDPRDKWMFTVDLDEGKTFPARHHDLVAADH